MTISSSTVITGPSRLQQDVPKKDSRGFDYDIGPIGVTVWFREWVEACMFAEELRDTKSNE